MAFSLFSKPTNKPKRGETPAKTPTTDVRPANDSKRPEDEAAKSPPSQSRKEKGNSTVLLGVSKDWRPAYSKIEVDESRTTLCSALENAALLFASGQSEAARDTLVDAVVNDHEARVSMLAWLALFDILQRMGDKKAVDDLALKFVVAFERSPPVWDDNRRAAASPVDAKAKGSVFVRFSGELASDNPGLETFVKATSTSPKCRVDFSGVNAADEDASRKLADLLSTLRRKSYPLQLQGGEFLAKVL